MSVDIRKMKSKNPHEALIPGASKTPRPHKDSGLMERYNTEYQRSRERGETVPKLVGGGYKVKALTGQQQHGAPGASSVRKTATSGEIKPTAGAGRARGVNIWYGNKGIAAGADSGESQRRGDKESESRGTSGDMDKG
jgi:hypothetical protein